MSREREPVAKGLSTGERASGEPGNEEIAALGRSASAHSTSRHSGDVVLEVDENFYERYIDELKGRYPKLRIVDKAESPLCHIIDGALRLITLGGQSHFQSTYVTTIGQTVYLPSDWIQRTPKSRYVVMRHEAVHLAQFARLGTVTMSLLYLLPILPMGLALGRARLEWEAYAETLKATRDVYGLDAAHSSSLRTRILAQFTGPAYGYMWPFPKQLNRWYDRVLLTL